jgi:hypothetical protein
MLGAAPITACLLLAPAILIAASKPRAQETQGLRLEATIPLGDVRGRIDHMTIDPVRQQLFVAELGNDSAGVVDLKERRLIHRISGLSEPQGVGYLASNDTLYIADGGDGSLRLYSGAQYTAGARIALGSDADNVRIDSARQHVIVGYGGGALVWSMPRRPARLRTSA